MSPPMLKDTSVWTLLGKLATEIGGENFQIVDHWDAALFSVGIASTKNPRRLVYISTFKKAPGRFAYECESPSKKAIYKVASRSEDVSFQDLLGVIRRHLGLTA